MSLFYYPTSIFKKNSNFSRNKEIVESNLLFTETKSLLQVKNDIKFGENYSITIKKPIAIFTKSKIKNITLTKKFSQKIYSLNSLVYFSNSVVKKFNFKKNKFKNIFFDYLRQSIKTKEKQLRNGPSKYKKKSLNKNFLIQSKIKFDFIINYFLKNNNYILYDCSYYNLFNYNILFGSVAKEKYFLPKKVNTIENLYLNKDYYKNFLATINFETEEKSMIKASLIKNFNSFKIEFIINSIFLIILNFIKTNIRKYLKLVELNFNILSQGKNQKKEKISLKQILNKYIKQLTFNCLLKLIIIYSNSINIKNINIKNYLLKKIYVNNSNQPLSILINLNNFYNRFFNFYFKFLIFYFSLSSVHFCFQLVSLRLWPFKKNDKINKSKIKVKNYFTYLKVPLSKKLRKTNTLDNNYFLNLVFSKHKLNKKTDIFRKLLLIVKKKHNNKSNSWVLNKYLFKTFYKLIFLKFKYQNISLMTSSRARLSNHPLIRYKKINNITSEEKESFNKKKLIFLKLKKKMNNYIYKNILVKNNILLTYYLNLIKSG